MKKRLDTSLMNWMNRPSYAIVGKSRIVMETEPYTDLWYNHHLHLQKFNAPALLLPIHQDFTLSFKMQWQFHTLYDQAGLLVVADQSLWCKAGVEYRDEQSSSICSTVTYGGFSDWAGMPISSGITSMYFRVHRWQNEFFVEFSFNGNQFKWLREFSLPLRTDKIQIGVYACSPQNSSFDVEFTDMVIESLQWKEKRNK